MNAGLTPGELDNVATFVEARAVLLDMGGISTEVVPVVCTAQERAHAEPAATSLK